MTSDYLKQLQLTKQLEQKAKEAAKNRKLAEERLTQADGEVARAKKMGAETKALEEEHKEAQLAFGRREYAAALDLSDKVALDARKLQADKVEEVLESAYGVVAMVEDKGEDHRAVEVLLDRSRQLMKEGRTEEAMAAAVDTRTAAEQYADRRMSEMFVQLAHLIDVGEKEKLAVAARKQALAKAIKLHEEGDRAGSLSKAVTCFKGLQEAFSKLAETRANSIMELVEGAIEGGDMSVVTGLVERSREAMARGRIEESFQILDEAQAAIRPVLANAVEVLLARQRERNEWLNAHGFSAVRFAPAIKKVSEAYAAGDSEEALELLRRSEKTLRESEMEIVLNHIETLRPRMVLAKRTNLNIDRVVTRLEEARTATVYGRAGEAMDIVDEASAELDDVLAPFRRVERELDTTRKAFLQARRMHIVSTEASQLVAKAREDALAGRLGDSYDTLAKARGVLTRIVQERCARQVFNGHLMVAAGISIGADVEDKAEDLDDVVEDLKEGILDGISARLAALNLELEAALIAGTLAELRRATQAMESVPTDTDLSAALEIKRQAQEMLDRKDWYSSRTLAERVREEIEKARRTTVTARKAQARALIGICAQLKTESQTLVERMASIELERGTDDETIRQVDEIIMFAKALARDEVARALAQVVRSSAAARKKGVSTAHVDRLTEEASRSLTDDDLERGFTAYEGARKELEKTTAMHSEVYDLIVLLSRLSGELHLPADSKVPQQLLETKRLFEAGLYDGARTSARACYKEAETVGAAILAPRAMQEAKALLPVIKQLGISTEAAEAALAAAAEDLRKGEAFTALASAKEERRKMVDTATESIQAEIKEVRGMLQEYGSQHVALTVMDIVEKAESLLADQRFADALQAARFARNEAGQFLNARASAGHELSVADAGIRAIESLDIDVSEAREILDQARKHRIGGRCNLVAEIARNALQGARVKAEEAILASLAGIEQETDLQDLKGKDLGRGPRTARDNILSDLKEGRYTAAHMGLDVYRDSLTELREVRETCITSLSKLSESMVRLPVSPYKSEAEALLTRAQKAFQEGAFHDALALSGECRAAGSSALKRHQLASIRLEEARGNVLEGEGRKAIVPEVADLLEAAGKALANGRYESMDTLLLRALRIHSRERSKANAQAIADLVNTAALFARAGLPLDDLPLEARSLLDRGTWNILEVRNLRETTAEVHQRVRKAVEERLTRTKRLVDRGRGEMEAARSLLASASKALADDRLEPALSLVTDAERAIGATVADVLEARELTRRYREQAGLALALGGEQAGIDSYRQALAASTLTVSLGHLRKAVTAIEGANARFLPDLQLRAARVVNAGPAPAILVTVNGGRDGESTIAPVLWPERSVKLPGPPSNRITVVYRTLFMPRSSVKELVREGSA
ncbi:MAG: hypothetical protein SA339_07980 [Methanomassiliicoccus sp.]|nr:hypothetical protein [Methanomassiliicoccus sp.]